MDTPSIEALQRENDALRATAAHYARRAQRFARLRGLTARLAASLDRNALFDQIVHAAAELCEAPAAALLLLDESGEGLHLEAGIGLGAAGEVPISLVASAVGRVLVSHRPLPVEDTGAEPEDALLPLESGERPGALILAPIRVEGKPFGVVQVCFVSPRTIASDDVDLLDSLSDVAAIALRNATAYARILDQGADLARSHEALVRQAGDLVRLNEDLRRATLLKTQFLATMSHELRTPLTSIIGFSSIVLRGRQGETLSSRQRDNVERILNAARRLISLINDMLDLSRIEAGRLDILVREMDLRALLEAVRAELEPQAHVRGLAVHVEVEEGLSQLISDQDRLRQVLTNLVDNAIKFTHYGGVWLRARQADTQVTIEVTDSGAGISPDQQERIFDDFYQADQSTTRREGGTGLGLAISRKLVGLLGGEISVRSVLGQGSTFTILLPVAPASDRVLMPAITAAHTSRENARVLMIDDDAEMLLLQARALEGTGYSLIGASSAEEGLHLARDLQPYAVLLDVMMPDMDGWRALHRLKADPLTADIPVVVHSIVDDRLLGFSLGATDYLVKPVDREGLLAALDRLAPQESGPVLVVDDDEDISTLVSSLLEDEQVRVLKAAHGWEALDLASQQTPRLIVLDLMLPGMDGMELLRHLRENPRTQHVPVIIFTGKSLDREEERQIADEATLVLAKGGVSLERLLDEVRGVMRLHS